MRNVTLAGWTTPPPCWRSRPIKQLKARYCRYLDTKDWQAWRGIFADDFLSDTSPAGGKVIRGADDFVAFTHKSLGNRATAHQVHAPGDRADVGDDGDEASGRSKTWSGLAPGVNLRGYGHYHETYEKIDGQWRITSSNADPAAGGHLQRLLLRVPL